MIAWRSVDRFIHALLASGVLGLVSSVYHAKTLSRKNVSEMIILFCVELDIKP